MFNKFEEKQVTLSLNIRTLKDVGGSSSIAPDVTYLGIKWSRFVRSRSHLSGSQCEGD
jgi:hypothetical protein